MAQEDARTALAALVLGARTEEDVPRVAGLAARRARSALARIVDAGVAAREGERYALVPASFRDALDAASRRARADERVVEGVRQFFRGGRLVSIPAARSKRLLVLKFLAERFAPGQLYAEKEVNETLRELHPDYASLRRYLIDEGFMDRRQGRYWRAGSVMTTRWLPPR